MDMTNVADKLRKPARRVPWIVGGVAGVGLVVAAAFAGPSIAANLNPAPTPSPTLNAYVSPPLNADELASVQSGADQQAATIAAEVAAKAAAAKAAQQAEQSSGPGWAPGQAPAGTPIPLHLDTDPNSGSYGQMVIENPDQFCASNGGTTAPNGEAVCS